jgi:hypothetical protein
MRYGGPVRQFGDRPACQIKTEILVESLKIDNADKY